MVTGNCLCGTVSWKAEEPFGGMVHCHCSMCRKAHGATFATYVIASREGFSWVSGEDAIVHYESSPEFMRSFCGECGSVVPETGGENQIAMPAGCLNEDPGLRPSAHIFAPSKAPYYEFNDDLRQFDGYPGTTENTQTDHAHYEKSKDGVLHGSCLCGDVAYEIATPIKVVHNCHCSRCRKARAAANATNGFTEMAGVTYVRGEDRLVTYRLPSAQFFSQTFCTRCGSGMPRLDPGRDLAIIPLSSLDTAPERGGDDHVCTGSMAEWDVITDDLPCFEELPT